MVKAGMKQEVIDHKKEENDDLLIDVVNKQIKMRKDSIESTVDTKVQKIYNAAINYAEDNLSSVPNEFTDSSLHFNSDESRKCYADGAKTFDGTEYEGCEKYCLIVYIGCVKSSKIFRRSFKK